MTATTSLESPPVARTSLRDRLKAGGIHLCISAIVALLSAALIFLVWYPAPLAATQGVDSLVLLMIQIDVVLGPILTVVVYQVGKKSLKFDLAVIGTLQMAALLYGLGTIFQGRPVLVVYNIDQFNVVSSVEVDADSLKRSIADGKPDLSWFGPRTVIAFNPTDRKELDKLLTESIAGGPDLPNLPHLQVPYEEGMATVIPKLRPMALLKKVSGMSEQQWGEFSRTLPASSETLGWVPVRTKSKETVALLDRRTGALLELRVIDSFSNPAPAAAGGA